MQPSPGPVAQAGEALTSGEFLIPDLCAPRPVFVMVLLVELMVLAYALSISTLPDFNWGLLAIGSLFVQWIVLLSAASLCGLRRMMSGLNLPLVSVSCLLVVLAATGLSSVVAWRVLPYFHGSSSEAWWLVRNLLVASVLTGIMLRYFYLQQQLLIQRQQELQARLDSLRARIRPHFLFNTLNNIASLIVSHPDAAERAIEDLAELLRMSLREQSTPTTVADELRVCELYLAIEHLRLGDRLQVQWNIDPALLDKLMPSLMLQPLVENAVNHGVAQLANGGTVNASVQSHGSDIRVVVENPVPARAARSGGQHMGLENIRQRLQVLYESAAGLRVEHTGSHFRVELHYPQRARA